MIFLTAKNTEILHRVTQRFFSPRPLRLLCVLCGLFLIASCSQKQEEKTSEPGKYFDLVAYFHNEATALNAAKPEITKTITKDGETETHTFSDTINWKKELKIFSENGINKPAWSSSFAADTITEDGKNIITYKADDKKISVKEIKIFTDNSWQPTEICIKRNAKNFLYTSEQVLCYIPAKSYRVDSEMHVRWTFDTKFSVEGVFTN